ncbi:DNA cytosine methyltransferase [Curtobacterium sp. MCBA15_012]|uniref:DNA cytosine methyltransferase n=1 Tax=Curtobacterium sp. MCBA15_012 TaxID=1898738 RepID=UPI000AEEA99C|nr:DNA (cytosine-5-)-methyltransferase [Curtobacterium sp. MCBA15_012]WIB00353.1 DNA (cytosine-5-)-methyltransferase [Curtobacterium sp. MCBA15_012]
MTLSNEFVPSRIKSTDPLHEQWNLTLAEREVFRRRAREARLAKDAAAAGLGGTPLHPVNVPMFNPDDLMPQLTRNGLSTLSLFSGGGGLDLGFDRAGFDHQGSWEILPAAAETLRRANPSWSVYGGDDGDVREVDWKPWRGNVAVLHGGPPCQPFSNAGKQRGASDPRDMWPEFVRAVLQTRPEVFVAENVAALASATFSDYVEDNIIRPLERHYQIRKVLLQAYEYGVPQVRKRVVFFGFRTKTLAKRWAAPSPQYRRVGDERSDLPTVVGAREALGLPDIGFDDVSPTIRSGLSGPRHTTSILSSVSAQRRFEALQIWPNGVAATRDAASAYVTKNGHFRLSVADVALLQGFPESWRFAGATYMQLGQIGNSVVPPVAYSVASSVAAALR